MDKEKEVKIEELDLVIKNKKKELLEIKKIIKERDTKKKKSLGGYC